MSAATCRDASRSRPERISKTQVRRIGLTISVRVATHSRRPQSSAGRTEAPPAVRVRRTSAHRRPLQFSVTEEADAHELLAVPLEQIGTDQRIEDKFR